MNAVHWPSDLKCSVCESIIECEDLSEKPSPYNTVYEHLPLFRSYQASKVRQILLEKRLGEELCKAGLLTNLCVKCQIPENFCTQAAAKIYYEKALNEHKKTESLDAQTKALFEFEPIKCPVTNCSQQIFPTGILAHFVNEDCCHRNYIEVLELEEAIINFNSKNLCHGRNICVGMILYGGKSLNENPGVTGLSLANTDFYNCLTNYLYHLPILVMVCRTHLTSMFGTKCSEMPCTKKEPKNDVLIIWLVSSHTLKPIHAQLHAENGQVRYGMTITIQDINQTQWVHKFLCQKSNYLIINAGLIEKLTNDNMILLRIKIFESNKN